MPRASTKVAVSLPTEMFGRGGLGKRQIGLGFRVLPISLDIAAYFFRLRLLLEPLAKGILHDRAAVLPVLLSRPLHGPLSPEKTAAVDRALRFALGLGH